MSDEAVASAIGKPLADFTTAESGTSNFTAEDIVNLCPVLRVKPSWFFDGLLEQ